MAYEPLTWIDDDGSGTVGTAFSAARMNNIETGIAGLDTVGVFGVEMATDGSLPAYTRTGNKLEANSNGALGAIDGVTAEVGDLILVKVGTSADQGPYKVISVGSAGAKWSMERVSRWSASAQVMPGTLILVAKGTRNQRRIYQLRAWPYTINSSAPLFAEMPSKNFGVVGSLPSQLPGTTEATAYDRATLEPRTNVFIDYILSPGEIWTKLRNVGQGVIPCRVATTAALPANTLSNNKLVATSNGALGQIDGVTLTAGEQGDVILVKDEAETKKHGPYRVVSLGSAGSKYELERIPEFSVSADAVSGTEFPVRDGTFNGEVTYYLKNAGAVTLNTTELEIGPIRRWNKPTLLNEWKNYGATYEEAQYRKGRDGKVHIRGLVKRAGAFNASEKPIFTLPEGFRPASHMLKASFGGINAGPGGVYRLTILNIGNVYMDIGAVGVGVDFFSISDVSFYTD